MTILECIVTTRNDDGSPNISPMGATVEPEWRTFALRPYQTAQTFANLVRTGEGVLHVTDDVELLAMAAVNRLSPIPGHREASNVSGVILNDACRWFEFRVEHIDRSQERSQIDCRVVSQGEQRPFFGFNRAKHAVLEAAILATRVHLLPAEAIRQEFERLAVPVAKTAGPQETRAFAFLQRYIAEQLAE